MVTTLICLDADLIDAYSDAKGAPAVDHQSSFPSPHTTTPASNDSTTTNVDSLASPSESANGNETVPAPVTPVDLQLDVMGAVTIPPPSGKYYSPYEMCELYAPYDLKGKHNNLRKKVAKEMLLKHAPCKETPFYQKYALYKAGKLNESSRWKIFGRPGKLNNIHSTIKILVEQEKAVYGMKISYKKLEEICIEAMLQEWWLDEGNGEHQFEEPCDATLAIYCSRILADRTININPSATNKNQTRFSAEDSPRSTIAVTMATAASHYWPGKKVKDLHVMDDEPMSPGAKMMRELVEECNPGVEMQHVLPGLCTTTDACTSFGTVGQVQNKATLFVTSSHPQDTTRTEPSSSNRSNSTTERHGGVS